MKLPQIFATPLARIGPGDTAKSSKPIGGSWPRGAGCPKRPIEHVVAAVLQTVTSGAEVEARTKRRAARTMVVQGKVA